MKHGCKSSVSLELRNGMCALCCDSELNTSLSAESERLIDFVSVERLPFDETSGSEPARSTRNSVPHTWRPKRVLVPSTLTISTQWLRDEVELPVFF